MGLLSTAQKCAAESSTSRLEFPVAVAGTHAVKPFKTRVPALNLGTGLCCNARGTLQRVIGPTSSRSDVARRASILVAAGVALLVSHDAVFLVQLGPGHELSAALRGGGHAYWSMATAILLAAGASGAGIWFARIRALRRLAADAGEARSRATPLDTWRRRAISHWIRLFAVLLVVFALQENAEHVLTHGHAIGLGALFGPEYPLALPVLAIVASLTAALTAAVRHREVELLDRIRSAAARLRRAPRALLPWRPVRRQMRYATLMAVHRALRAPPRGILLAHP